MINSSIFEPQIDKYYAYKNNMYLVSVRFFFWLPNRFRLSSRIHSFVKLMGGIKKRVIVIESITAMMV